MTMQRPSEARKIVDPLSADIYNTAKDYQNLGQSTDITVQVERAILDAGKKGDVVRLFRQYGKIVENVPIYSIFFVRPRNLEAIKQMEDDFYDDKLPGVRAMELGQEVEMIDVPYKPSFPERVSNYFSQVLLKYFR